MSWLAIVVCLAAGRLGGEAPTPTVLHWAYGPLRNAAPPAGPPAEWTDAEERTPIDRFILRQLAAHRLVPSPTADRPALLRRVCLDLTGLPPTPGEIDAFVADDAPDAYDRVVDRLLASPRHGERWTRHWMDIAHFAETHGHDQDHAREHAWPYRDYLIQFFNEDRPYARFVEEQIAADVLFPEDTRVLPGLGFLAAGPWDESSKRDIRPDSIDRQIAHYLDRDDVVTTTMSTFVSTTVHCARCHDHKFDPVTQREYYGLQAVFAGIDKANRAYDVDPEVTRRRDKLTRSLREVREQRRTKSRALLAAGPQQEAAAWEKRAARVAHWQVLRPQTYRSENGTTLAPAPDGSLLASGERPETDTYTIVATTDLENITGIRLEVLTDDSLPHHGPGRQDNGNLHLSEFRVTARTAGDNADGSPVALRRPRADFNQGDWTIDHAIDGKPATAWGVHPQIGKPHHAVFTLVEPLRHVGGTTLIFELQQLHGQHHLIGRPRLSVSSSSPPFDSSALPTAIDDILAIAAGHRDDAQRIELAAFVLEARLEREIAVLPPQVLVYCGTSTFTPDGSFMPSTTPRPVHVLARGNIHKPGPAAISGALSCITGLPGTFELASPENEADRRAALAHWLTDPDNVLTWRSIVNRVWHYHFGRGIVDTPSDFGRMGGTPTHPELLDWLTVTFLESDTSLKLLHRQIVTSAVYRQSSRHDPHCARIDTDNRFLWRMNRRRLDAESIHDAILRISGMLDTTMGGPSVKQFIQTKGVHVTPKLDYVNFDVDDPANHRRSVYRFVFRTLPDPFMESLDCPDASQWTPSRTESMTALQALSMLNDKFVVRQSEHIASRAERQGSDPREHVKAAFHLILGRPPRTTPPTNELAAVEIYAQRHGLANACRFLLNSNEFMFIE